MGLYYIPRDDYLMHYGVKGQKWGIRRFQNPDGTLTAEGMKRYGYGNDKKIAKGLSKGYITKNDNGNYSLTDKGNKNIKAKTVGKTILGISVAAAAATGLTLVGLRATNKSIQKSLNKEIEDTEEEIAIGQDLWKKMARTVANSTDDSEVERAFKKGNEVSNINAENRKKLADDKEKLEFYQNNPLKISRGLKKTSQELKDMGLHVNEINRFEPDTIKPDRVYPDRDVRKLNRSKY